MVTMVGPSGTNELIENTENPYVCPPCPPPPPCGAAQASGIPWWVYVLVALVAYQALDKAD